ncbi:V-type proton ATPase subunit S1-like [Emydura macquarii macquarii]|uniref:V-type proton ATPase subunit S1-like n=1 Tax=Emydura macquarii macquarii TaxID=1129001 RepID=UPI00352A0B80
MAVVQLFYSLAVLLKLALSVDHVPMLLWSTHSSLWNSEATLHEGHIISKPKLHMLLQPVFTQDSKILVLFLQDTLSVDDFTYYSESYGNEKPFHNVQGILKSSSSSLVLSAVECQAISHLLDYLQESVDWKLTTIDEFEVSKLEVDTSKPNILMVKLQPIGRFNDISTAKAFAANDKIIGRLTKILQEQGIQFSAIYTAMRPSRIPRRPDVVLESRRRLMAVEAQVTFVQNPLNVTNGTNTCILFNANNFSLTANKSVHVDLTNLTFVSSKVDLSSSVCSATNATLSLNYTGSVDGINSLEIRFLMTNKFYTGSARNWFTLDSVEIVHDNKKVARYNVSIISAPAEYSFHCQLVGTSSLYGAKLIPANSEAKSWDVYISEFQIQGFNIKNNNFSYASDCTSFFSPGIWMGLVTSVVLLWILTYGIHMIMQLTTNSRFDDPKGPSLSVPQTE